MWTAKWWMFEQQMKPNQMEVFLLDFTQLPKNVKYSWNDLSHHRVLKDKRKIVMKRRRRSVSFSTNSEDGHSSRSGSRLTSSSARTSGKRQKTLFAKKYEFEFHVLTFRKCFNGIFWPKSLWQICSTSYKESWAVLARP